MWFLQAAVVGGATASVVDRQSRRLLPFATLLGLSLTFPGEAPSRLSVALQAGTIRDRERSIKHRIENGLSSDPLQAATEAITLVTVLGSHQRLTVGPIERTTSLADQIAAELGVDDSDQEKLRWATLLHDVGMWTLPSAILTKGGSLTGAENTTFESHATAGETFVAPLADWLGSWRFATSQHHERWDGNGFPKGIGGERITLSARIVSVVGAYDAIVSEGPNGASSDKAVGEVLASSGTSFDPSVVQALREVAPSALSSAAGGMAKIGTHPGLAVSAAQAVAVALVAAAMAAFVAPAPVALALDASVTAVPSETSTTLVGEMAAPDIDTQRTTSTRSIDDADLIADQQLKLTTTTVLDTSATDSSVASPTSTTTAPTTTAAPSTTALPTTTAAPRDTTAPTTVVELTTTSTTAAPTVTIIAGPSAVDDIAIARQDRNKRIDVLSNDVDGPSGSPIDVDTLDIVDGPSYGFAEIKSGQVRYRSNTDYLGEDTLTYVICNEQGTCSTAKVTITVG